MGRMLSLIPEPGIHHCNPLLPCRRQRLNLTCDRRSAAGVFEGFEAKN
jgi:hypothetical protein